VTCTLEQELVLDVLAAEVRHSDSAHVVLQGLLVVSLMIERVTDLDVALQPCVLKRDHLLEGRHRSLHVAELDADLSDAAKVVEVLLIFHTLSAAVCKLRQILLEKELGQVDKHLIFLSRAQAHILKCICRVDKV